MKTLVILIMLVAVILMLCSYGVGIERGKHDPAIVVNLEMNEDLFNAARYYHGKNGNIVIMYDNTESFYFIRKDERCSVFTKGFEMWYAKKLIEEEKDGKKSR